MNEATAIELIDEAFDTGWRALYGTPPTVQAIYENEGALQTAISTQLDTFVFVSALHTVARFHTHNVTGARRVERRGYIMVKTYAPADGGRKPSSTLCDAVRGILEGKPISTGAGAEPIEVLTGQTIELGNQGGRWYVATVRFDFYYFTLA